MMALEKVGRLILKPLKIRRLCGGLGISRPTTSKRKFETVDATVGRVRDQRSRLQLNPFGSYAKYRIIHPGRRPEATQCSSFAREKGNARAPSRAFTASIRHPLRGLLLINSLLFGSITLLGEQDQQEPPEHELLVIVGAPGEDRYEAGFKAAASAWKRAADSTHARMEIVGLDTQDESDFERIENWVTTLDTESPVPVWIIYIGHGTHTQKRTLLNLKGADLDSETFATWLEPIKRPLVFIHGGSASAPFINRLSQPNRILITATRSGEELNYARFGERFANVIESRDGDSNQDGQVSLLEAFVATARSVELFYEEAGRLASEHPLIDDNGDQTGTPADWFRGERLVKEPEDDRMPDGFRSRQIALIASEQESRLSPEKRLARDQLEIELEQHRSLKKSMNESEYYQKLETILRELSKIYLSDTNDS